MTLDDEQLRSLAEDAVEHMEPPAGEQRMADDRLIATYGSAPDPQMNVVSRLRLGSSVGPTANDSMLNPRRANSPAQRVRMPGLFRTSTLSVCMLI